MKLLAPNGKPSNLTPEQYRLVRTPEFKAWFGDWENSPEMASKVIDKNGEPLIVLHNTDTYDNDVFDKKTQTFGVQEFDAESWSKENGNYSFKTPNTKVNPIWFYLNYEKKGGIKKPFDSVRLYYDLWAIPFFINVKKMFDTCNYSDLKKLENYAIKNYGNNFIGLADEIKCDSYDSVESNYPFYKDRNSLGSIPALIKEMGYDGYTIKDEGGTIAVFDKGNYKLADGTNTTFDSNNPDIRYSNGGSLDGIYYIPTDKSKEIIESFTHYKSGENYYPRTIWANWFMSASRKHKERIAREISGNNEFKNALLSNWYDNYKKETNKNLTFEEFLNKDIEVYRGQTSRDLKYGEAFGFESYTIDKSLAEHFAEDGNRLVITKIVKPKDTYGLIDSIGNEREIIIPTKYSKEFLEKEWYDFSNENMKIFDNLSDKDINEFDELLEKSKNYEGAIEKLKLLIANDIRYEIGGIFHGSPYFFDKFSTGKMGTGIGQQDSGWGIYLTDHKDSAKNYGNYIYQTTLFKGKKLGEYIFIDLGKPVKKDLVRKILEAVYKYNGKDFDTNKFNLYYDYSKDKSLPKVDFNDYDLVQFDYRGFLFYKTLSRVLGGDKKASLFLLNNGVDGLIKNEENSSGVIYRTDYVIFDENAITLERREHLPNNYYSNGGELTLTSEQVENKLGRKLHWWNDDIVTINGANYKKVFLKPEYKIEE